MCIGAVRGQLVRPGHHFPSFTLPISLICKRLMCFQVVSEGGFIQVTKSNVLLRGLCDDDFEDWKVLWRMYLDFYETHLPEEVYKKTFERLLSGDLTSQNAIVAMGGGKIVGLVHFIFHLHNWKTQNTFNMAYGK